MGKWFAMQKKYNFFIYRFIKFTLLFILPFIIFLIWVPFNLLYLNNIWTLQGDPGIFTLATHIFRNDSWHWPLSYTQMALWPSGVALIGTAFNFITALFVKIFHNFLPNHVQTIGIEYLIACYGNFIALFIILKKASLKDTYAFLGAFLAVSFPPFFYRYFHAQLTWHFIIILSLYVLFFKKNRALLYFSLLSVLATLVHFYFFIPVLLMAFAKPFFDSSGNINKGIFKKACINLIICSCITIFSLWTIGYFDLIGEANGFGYFSMNLNAPFNPLNASRIIAPMPLGTEGQYEGFQYLGLGWFLYIIVVLAFAHKKIFSPRKIKILFLLCSVLTLLSLSNKIYFGQFLLLEYNVGIFKNILEIFRSSGRFFWLVGYIIIILCIVKAYKSFSTRIFIFLTIGAIALQYCDIRMPLHETFSFNHAVTDKNLDIFLKDISPKPNYLELQFWNEPAHTNNYYKVMTTSIDNNIPITKLYLARNKSNTSKIIRTYHETLQNNGIILSSEIDLKNIGNMKNSNVYTINNYFIITPPTIISNSIPFRKISFDSSNVQLENILDFTGSEIILISASDDAQQNLRYYKKFIKSLKLMGSNISQLEFRQSYAAIIYRGKLIVEEISNHPITLKATVNGKKITVTSKGLKTGSHGSSFQVDSKCHFLPDRGLNFLIFRGNNDPLVYSANYDTCFIRPPAIDSATQ